jgi:zinc protease
VLTHLLGNGSNSRLYRALVLDQKIAIGASAWYDGTALDYGSLGVAASPREGVTLQQAEEAIDKVLAEAIEKGFTEDEIQRSKDRLIADAVYAQDNQATLARWYGAALTTGLTVDSVRTWTDRIRTVTPDQVKEAARKWFDKRRSVTGYLIKDTARPGGRS